VDPIGAALYSATAGRAALNDLRGWPIPYPRLEPGAPLTSNVAQSYPYTTETEDDRASIVARLVEKTEGLADKIKAEANDIPELGPDEPGRPHRWWVFVCPKHISGRLHVAGYAMERHALFTVCDEGGETYLR
jgi:hypothetical protein